MKKVEVVIVGLGYIGLPTAALIASNKVQVHGVDINPSVVETINKGEIHIVEPELDKAVASAVKNSYLKETEEFKNRFIANFSHELRDPLTGIMTFTDILSKTDLSKEQEDYLNVLKSSSSFLKQMIDDILDLSRCLFSESTYLLTYP